MHRIVHLDFKGAPLKVQYLDQVLESIRQWGATGVLLEWEDTFPYSGELSIIGSKENCHGDQMYTMDEVHQILQAIKSKGLEPIQLVQTIGHMEFVLKHPAFRELREEPRSPAVLCPTKPKSLQLVKAMVQNALNAQPDAKYFHIGADEPCHTTRCGAASEAISPDYRPHGALKDKTGYWDAAFYIAGIWVIVSGLLVAVIPYTKNFRIIGNAPLAKDVAVDPEPGVKIIIAH